MVRQFILSLSILIASSVAFAGPTSASVPNWFFLENRLYEEPQVVLQELLAINISTWADKQKVYYFDLLASAYLVLSDYELAEEALSQGLALKERAEPYTLVNMLTLNGYFKELSGDLAAAKADYHTALRLAEQSGSYDAMMVALNYLIGFYSFTTDQYDIALEYVERGSGIAKSVTRQFLVGDLYNAYGGIQSYLGDSEAALEQYAIAEAIYRKLNNNVSLSDMLYNRALTLEESEDYITALRTYQAFIDQAQKWGDPTAQFFGNMGIANCYSYLERFDQAYTSMQLAQEALPYIADPVYQFDFWTSVVYIAADVEDFEWASLAIAESERLLKQLSDEEQSWYLAQVLNTQKYVAKTQQDFAAAFEYSEELRRLQLDLQAKEQEDSLSEMRISSENAMYKSETDRLSAESRKQQEIIAANKQLQQILIALSVMLVVSVVILGVTLRRKIRQMRILQQYSAISESVKTSGQRIMENVAGLMFDQSERRKSPLSVVVFDFSNMSDIREQFGQVAADEANSWIKETLGAELREEDKSGQISFGRYMMLLPGAEAKLARKQAERLIAFFKENTVPGFPTAHLDVSVGISERSRYDRNPNVLTHRATTAVDIARDHGNFTVKILAV